MLLFYGVVIPEKQEMGIGADDSSNGSSGFGWSEPAGYRPEGPLGRTEPSAPADCLFEPAILHLPGRRSTGLLSVCETVPGSARLTAMILLAELVRSGVSRLLDELSCYVGLIPDTQASGEKEYVGALHNGVIRS